MKTIHYVLSLMLVQLSFATFAQNVNANRADYARIEKAFSDWDPVRGPWLASSLSSMADNQPIPDRNFPEKFTPHQMLTMVPYETRSQVMRISSEARTNGGDQAFWSDINRYVSSPNCQSSSGRSYGDPHLISYDGARNSFQTVGEFVLTRSLNGEMEVQSRQRPVGDDFSLNTALAMNVAGDRVCLYTKDYPDGDYSTPVRIEGRPVQVGAGTYFLEHGGTIRKSGQNYTVFWPSGESVTAQVRRSGNTEFMDVTVHVHDCADGQYEGLLGNANGSTRDDYATSPGVSPVVWDTDDDYLSRKRQEYMAKDFAEMNRITQQASLFDYMIGANTMTYTDRSFPHVYRNFSDINQRRLAKSQRYCHDLGLDARDIQGCVYDHAYLGLGASEEPIIPSPTKGTVLRPTDGRLQNVNPPKPTTPVVQQPDSWTPRSGSNNSGGGRTLENDNDKPDVRTPRTEPKPRIEPTPRVEPRPAPRPAPVPRTPTPAPRPSTPKPSAPKPTPRPSGRGL